MVNHQHRVRERKEDICRKRRKWPISAATQNSKPKWKACKMKRILQIVIQMRQTAGGRCAPVNFAKPISFEAAGPPFEHVSPVKSTRRQRYLINMISFPCPEHCSSYQLELQMRGVCACLRSIPAATFFISAPKYLDLLRMLSSVDLNSQGLPWISDLNCLKCQIFYTSWQVPIVVFYCRTHRVLTFQSVSSSFFPLSYISVRSFSSPRILVLPIFAHVLYMFFLHMDNLRSCVLPYNCICISMSSYFCASYFCSS